MEPLVDLPADVSALKALVLSTVICCARGTR